MTIKFYKTYTKNYLSLLLFPSIAFEGFKEGDKCVYIGWLIYGFLIKW